MRFKIASTIRESESRMPGTKHRLEDAMSVVRKLVHPGENAWLESYLEWHHQRFERDVELLSRLPGRVLDVGAYPYVVSLALKSMGRDVTAVDLNEPTESPGLPVLVCDIETDPIPAPDGSFDVVLLAEVFEHLRIDLMFTLGELRRVLKPGGTLLLTTPNLWSVRGLCRLLVRKQAWAISADPAEQWEKLATFGRMGHVREYTVVEVAEILRAAGFEVSAVQWRIRNGPRWATSLERLVSPMRPEMVLLARPA